MSSLRCVIGAVAAVALAAPAAATIDQDVEVRNRVQASSSADPGAMSRARPVQRATNRQRLRAKGVQAAALDNDAVLASRARDGARSDVVLSQRTANRQVLKCAECRQRTVVANHAELASEATAGMSAVYVGQRAHAGQTAHGCRCAQSGGAANQASVRSTAARTAEAGRTTVATEGAARANVATISQAGRANAVALQQSDQHVEQAGAYNVARVVTRQTLVFDGMTLVEKRISTRVRTRTLDVAPAAPPHRAGQVCARRAEVPARDCESGGNVVRATQRSAANLAAVQQATQRVRQVGVRNVAVTIIEQRIVLRHGATAPRRFVSLGCAARRRSLAAVQQASQVISQSGRFNVARTILKRSIEIAGVRHRCENVTWRRAVRVGPRMPPAPFASYPSVAELA